MKKLLLLAIGGALSIGAGAQQQEQSILLNGENKYKAKTPANEYNIIMSESRIPSRSAAKGTGPGGKRWYDYFNVVSTLNNGIFSTNTNWALVPIWGDTVVRQRFITGYSAVNYTSVSQIVDPITSALFNDASFGQVIGIKSFNAYKVDSVAVTAAYVREPLRSTNIVDTLIISVRPEPQVLGYRFGKNHSDADIRSKVSAYLAAAQSTDTSIFAMAPQSVDSIQKTLSGGVTWRVLLDNSMGDAPQGTSVTVKGFSFAVPNGGLNMPAGSRPAVSFTFKSGDTYTVADSINMFHRFMPLSGFLADNSPMKYYTATYNDYSNGGLMFSFDSSRYLPSIIIELVNENSFRYEYHDIALHMTCADCDLLSVDDVAGNIQSANAYPNPASNMVAIPFSLKNAADVKVSLVNTFGQVIATQEFSGVQTGSASFNVANVAAGLYMYSVEANGEVKTGRLSVVR